MLTTRPRGINDILPGEVERWQALEAHIRRLFSLYHYEEIRTPIFEHTELFLRSVGETSDIVEKEMYSFEDKGLRHVTLRPEGTAGVVRAYIENRLFAGPAPQKLFYIGPMFRYDQPQAGRYRQFHQFGCEVLGSDAPVVDAEVITFAVDLFSRLGLQDLKVSLNTVGCPACRPAYEKALVAYFEAHLDDLCDTCKDRLHRNPLRILDCKEEGCARLAAEAPTTLDYACDHCRDHFSSVRAYLDGVGIPYELDSTLVRGLDYYTQTAFEVIMTQKSGAQNAICGGGRYNKLVYNCGGKDTPGVGFAAGMERLLLILESQGIDVGQEAVPGVYLAPLDQEASQLAFQLAKALRAKDIAVEMDCMGKSLKAQMKTADRLKARYSVLIGENERLGGYATVRQMADGDQTEVPLDKLVIYLEERINHVATEKNA